MGSCQWSAGTRGESQKKIRGIKEEGMRIATVMIIVMQNSPCSLIRNSILSGRSK
ncbi:hypothetical protein SBDP1_430069 [Syntrophobacter sp. SbD1]|nr:hypothetical protein SBDP1_430069 [Syntrophobacter sp. SbD1]